MVKSVLGVNHQGFRDWVIQRVSAIVMAVYSIALIVYIIAHPGLTFAEWHHAFALMWVKVATILFILSLLFHAWVGIWTVLTDYVKPVVLNCVLQILIVLALIACFIWAVLILWSF